jgi:acyl carrier protein
MPEDQARTGPGALPDAARIEAWLVSYIAGLLGAPTETIDVRRPFTYFGLSSADSVVMAGDLERWLGGGLLSPTLAWDYPTIEKLSRYLANGGAGTKTAPSVASGYGDEELESLLSDIERLPEDNGVGMTGVPTGGSQPRCDE